jgi:uncharacterized membrane protein
MGVLVKEWRRNLRNNPKRYAITSAIFYALWMTVFLLGYDRIRHQRISIASVMIALIICSFGGVFIGYWRYRRRMQEINEGNGKTDAPVRNGAYWHHEIL